jgi:hypothetical protein
MHGSSEAHLTKYMQKILKKYSLEPRCIDLFTNKTQLQLKNLNHPESLFCIIYFDPFVIIFT